MGTLVKTAQIVENRVGKVRRAFELKTHSKWQKVRAEWLELKSRRNESPVNRMEAQLRTPLIQTYSKFSLETAKLMDKLILALESVKRALP